MKPWLRAAASIAMMALACGLMAQSTPVKNSTTDKKAAVKPKSAVVAHATAKKAVRAKKPVVQGASVEVINGTERKVVTFSDSGKPAAKAVARPMAKTAPARTKTKPGEIQVEIINGTRREVKTLPMTGAPATAPADPSQPVVVGIVSGDTRRVGGNKDQVVVGVESSGDDGSTTIGKTTRPVAVGVSPKPKRKPYRPQ